VAGGDPETGRRAITAKFRQLVAPRLGATAADRLVAAIGRLDDVDDIRELTRH
jgi:hypothetical protein